VSPDRPAVVGGAVGPRPVSRRDVAFVAALTLLAAFLRLWRLGDLPPGLHVDEAFNILDARAVLGGWRPVFLPANAGREVLFTYLQAPVLALLGDAIFSARLVSAIAGTLTVPVAWWFTGALPIPRAGRVALLTAGLTALSYWHLHFSRFGIRAVLFPLVVTLTMWAWWRVVRNYTPDAALPGDSDAAPTLPCDSGGGSPRAAWRGGGSALAVLAVLLALAVYTHPAGRGLVVVPALHAMWLWWRRRDVRPARALVVAGASAALLVLPVAVYWWQHPWTLTGHAGEVSIVAQGPRVMATNAVKVAAMFNVAGDPEPWRNLTSRPTLARVLAAAGVDDDGVLPRALRGRAVFDPLTGLAFLAGLAIVLAAVRRGADWAVLVLIWLVVLLVPSIVTDAAPNFSRAIGAIPVVFLLPALAIDRFASVVAGRWGRIAASSLVGGWLAMTGMWTARDYFSVWASDPDTPIAFDADKAALARYVHARAVEGKTVYLTPTMAGHATVRAIAGDVRGFDARYGLVLPPGGAKDAEYVFPADDAAWDSLSANLGTALIVTPLAEQAVFREAARRAVAPGRADDSAPDWAMVNGQHYRSGTLAVTDSWVPPFGEWSILLQMTEQMRDAPGTPFDARLARAEFGHKVRLVAARVEPVVFTRADGRRDGTTRPVTSALTTSVTVAWLVLAPTETDLSAMVHICDPSGQGWGDGDGAPVGGSYPTTAWRPGEILFDTHVVTARNPRIDGPAEIRVGWYDWRTGERLLITDGWPAEGRENGTTAVAATTIVVPPPD
jgi:hypothetical protein